MPTFSNLTNGSSTTSFVTASVSPAVNRLVLVTINAYIATGSLPPSTPTVTGNGITYTLEESVAIDNSGADQSMLFVFRGKLAALSTGAITLSFSGVVPTRCSWSVDQGSTDIDVTGANASGAIVQKNKATSSTTVTTQAVNFLAGMTSGNGAYFACGIENNNSQTVEGTWTQTANQIGTSLIGLSTGYLTTGTDTGTANTWTTAARAGGIIIEILAAAAVAPGDTSESKIYAPGFMSPATFPAFMVNQSAPFMRSQPPFWGIPDLALPGTITGVEPESHGHNPAVKDGNDNLYRVMESDLASGNHPMMMKSSNGGITWAEVDSGNRPVAVDFEASWIIQEGTQLVVGFNRDDTCWRLAFNTSDAVSGADTWGATETVDTGLSSTGVEQYVSQVQTSNGQEWWFYSDTLATTNQQMAYRHRTAVNTYSAKTDLGGNTAVSYTGPASVLGASDLTHVFYTDVTNAHLYYRTLTTSGTLSGATQVDSAGTSNFSASPSRYAHTNPVYYNDGTEVISVLYVDTSEMLKLVRIVGGTPQTVEAVSTSSVLCNPSATTSDAPVAHIAVDGTTLLCIWSDFATGDIYLRRRHNDGTWDAIENLWASGGNFCMYVYNLVFTRAGRRIMGYAYDVGDHPNDISNMRYNEVDLGPAFTLFTSSLSGTVGFTGVRNDVVGTHLAATLAFTGAQTRRVSHALTAATLAFTGALTKLTARLLTATLNFTGALSTAVVHHFTQALNATVGFTGTLVRGTRTNLVAAVSYVGTLTRRVARTQTAQLTFTGVLPRQTSHPLTAQLSWTGLLTRRTSHPLTATVSFTGSLTTAAVHFFTQALSATLSFTGTRSVAVRKSIAASLSWTGQTLRGVAHGLTASLSFTGAQTRRTTTTEVASVGFTGTQARRTAKTLVAAGVSFTGTLATAAVHFFTKALTATLSFTGSLSTQHIFTKLLAATVGFTGAMTRRVGKAHQATLAFTTAQTRRIGTRLSAALSFTTSFTIVPTLISALSNLRVRIFGRESGGASGREPPRDVSYTRDDTTIHGREDGT